MGTLYKDLIEAMAEFKTLPKDKKGYNYMYTDFDTVVSTVRPILTAHKIGYSQPLVIVDGKNALKTIVFNADGETLESVVALPDVELSKGNTAQKLGAAITYMKRYALCAILGISADEDVDGNTEKGPAFSEQKLQSKQNAPAPAKQNDPAPAKQKKQKMTEEQVAKMNELFTGNVFTEEEKNTFRKQFATGSENPSEFIQRVDREYNKRLNEALASEEQSGLQQGEIF